MGGWRTQVASDVGRNGLGVELLNASGEVVAEILRCDADNSVAVNTFGNDIPLRVIEWLIDVARERLDSFEDGTPLPAQKQELPKSAPPDRSR